jgi:hypothetical protein
MRRLVLLAVISLSACAGVDIEANQCAAAHDLGYRDAIMGLQPQDGLYGPKCVQKGTRLDLAVYRQGWLDGHFDLENRMPHTE